MGVVDDVLDAVSVVGVGSFLVHTLVVWGAMTTFPVGAALPTAESSVGIWMAPVATLAILALPLLVLGTFVRTVRLASRGECAQRRLSLDSTVLLEGFYAVAILLFYVVWVSFLGLIPVDLLYYERPLSLGQIAFGLAAALPLAVIWCWNYARLVVHAVGTREMTVSWGGLVRELGIGAHREATNFAPALLRTTVKPELYADLPDVDLWSLLWTRRFGGAVLASCGLVLAWVGLIGAVLAWPPAGGQTGAFVTATVLAPATVAVTVAQGVALGRAWADVEDDLRDDGDDADDEE